MKQLFTSLFTIVAIVNALGQALLNNAGSNIYLLPGAFMIVKTNSVHNQNGTIENGGQLVIEGNILNDANLIGSTSSPTGFYRVQGDWINNATVTSNQDTVELYGDNQQITGTTSTAFNNLILSGNNTAIKTQTVDAHVAGFLDLKDVELATQNKNMVVLNPAVNAIRYSLLSSDYGFVSSLDTGKLIRHTNTISSYYYPLGTPTSTGTPFYYRPLEIKPTNTIANAYGARLAKDPTAETYNVNTLDNILCKVNPLYYHRINHPEGTNPADVKFLFDAAIDNRWTDVGHWETNRWNYTNAAVASTSGGFNTLEIKNWNDYDPQPFALASKKFTVDAGPDQILFAGQSANLNPTIGTSNVASYAWSPDVALDAVVIRNPTASPTTNTVYTLKVTDDLGCEVMDSLLIKIKNEGLLIPTAFSPNADGYNDLFRVLNDNIDDFTMIVFNRWGEKVYETSDIRDGWDGSYKDVAQDVGVYVWNVTYKPSWR
jgi:gliding motility-associated-like protein